MNDYISKQKVLDYLNGYLHSLGEDADTLFNRGQRRALTNSIQDILAVKAAEVQPIRRGRWTDNVYKYVKSLDAYFIQAKCSVCGRYSDRIDIYSRFMSNECCSRCGARMDGEQNDNSET